MPGNDIRAAMARRDDGIRKISRLTWRVGAAGVICSGLMAAALGHHAQQPPSPGTIVVPGQPPAPAKGAGQVTSGAS